MLAEVPEWVQALVLGLVQGLTEFIPVSSSGHLVLVPALAGWERHGLAFDVALHLGTLFALVVYYRRDLWQMLRAVLPGSGESAERAAYRSLVVMLALASLPVAVVGLMLDEAVESVFGDPVTTAWLLLGTAAVLVAGERIHRARVRRGGDAAPGASADAAGDAPANVAVWQALTVGVAQSFALLPGLTRSGLTISAGIAAGLSRTMATRFAFLLGLPAIAGAAVVQIPQVDDLGTLSTSELVVGVTAAAVSGYVAIALLVRLVSRAGIDRFAPYVVGVWLLSMIVLR